MERFEIDATCPKCHGSGIYQGMAERDGFAVQCYSCNGEGHKLLFLEWEPFAGKLCKTGVKTVVKVNPGIMLGGDHHFGGMGYSDGHEMRLYTCPAWWLQCAGGSYKFSDKCPTHAGSKFSSCPKFADKAFCWMHHDTGRYVE